MGRQMTYVYRLTCGEIAKGPKGLEERHSAVCHFHGATTIAGMGIPLSEFLAENGTRTLPTQKDPANA